MKSLLVLCLAVGAFAGGPNKQQICQALAKAESCLADPSMTCVESDVCKALEENLGRLGNFACSLVERLSDHSLLPQIAKSLNAIVRRLESQMGCSASAVVEADVCTGVENALCALKSGDIEGAVKELCNIVANFVPAASKWCQAIPHDLAGVEKGVAILLTIIAKAEGCQPHACAFKAAPLVAESTQQLCEGCYKADCLFKSGDIDAAEKEICAMVEMFVPGAEPICAQILQGTGMGEKVAEALLKVIEDSAGCPAPPPCPQSQSFLGAVTDLRIDQKSCSIIQDVFCTLHSGDPERAEEDLCSVVEDLDPKIRGAVAKVCHDIVYGTQEAADAVDAVLKMVLTFGGCGSMPPCPHSARLLRSGLRPKVFASNAELCKGAEAFCCQACTEMVSLAEHIVLASDSKKLAEEKLKEMCAIQYEHKPLQKMICDTMVEEGLDQLWQYIQAKMSPHLACVQMHACPDSGRL